MSFFKAYSDKSEGAIRFFDLRSLWVRIVCVLIFIVCILLVVVALFPAVWVVLSSFKDIKEFRGGTAILPQTVDAAGFLKTWNDLKFTQYYVNSFIYVAGAVVCAVVFNGILAYVLGVLRPKGYRIVFGMVMWTLLIPSITSIVALFVNINRLGLTDSFIPLWLSMGANAFWVVLFKQFFESLPRDYVEAAELDGCGSLQIFSRIMLPLSKPIVVVVAIFAVTSAWSDFLLPFLVLAGTDKETVMVRLFAFRTANQVTDVDILRAVTFAIIPPVIIFALFQKQITAGVTAGGIKG